MAIVSGCLEVAIAVDIAPANSLLVANMSSTLCFSVSPTTRHSRSDLKAG